MPYIKKYTSLAYIHSTSQVGFPMDTVVYASGAGECCPRNISECPEVWYGIEAKLLKQNSGRPGPVREKLRMLHLFVRCQSDKKSCNPIGVLDGVTAAAGLQTWDNVLKHSKWNSKKTIKAFKKQLVDVLLSLPDEIGRVIAEALHPDYTSTTEAADKIFTTETSQIGRFSIHECLSHKIRHDCGPSHPHYDFIAGLLIEFTAKIKTHSKNNLQQIGYFISVFYLGHGRGNDIPIWQRSLQSTAVVTEAAAHEADSPEEVCTEDTRLDPADATGSLLGLQSNRKDPPQRPKVATAREMRDWIRNMDIRLVLRHYLQLFGGGKKMKRITSHQFVRHIRLINQLHCTILHNTPKGKQIPIPKKNSRCHSLKKLEAAGYCTGSDTQTAYTMGSGGGADSGDNGRELSLLLTLSGMMDAMCYKRERDERVFLANDIEAMFRVADSTLERLMVYLLLTTGLRAGGVVRIRLPVDLQKNLRNKAYKMKGCDIEKVFTTTEKNGVQREFRLRATARILVAEWLSHHREKVDSPYLFPAKMSIDPRQAENHINTNTLNHIFMNICKKAGVVGGHAHLHTCRHTIVHYLHARGYTWQKISEWIGHKKAATTEKHYGHLSIEETEAGMDDVDTGGSRREVDLNTDRITKLYGNPWTFHQTQWEGLVNPSLVVAKSEEEKMAERKAKKRKRAETQNDSIISEMNAIDRSTR
jgi:hypothetical protein